MLQTESPRTHNLFTTPEDTAIEKNARSANFDTNEIMLNYITTFLNNLRNDTVQCVLDSFLAALQQLEDLIEIEDNQTVQILKRLNGFKETLPRWFNQRLIDSKMTCSGLNQAQIDAVTNFGLDQLLTANAADLALQMQTQQSFDRALVQFKSMLVNSGFGTKTNLGKLPISRELYCTNPVNLSTLINPIITKLANSQPITWTFYRLLHKELYTRLPDLYKAWEKSLRNYHSMICNHTAH